MNLACHPEFALGNVHTDFIPQHEKDLFLPKFPSYEEVSAAILCNIYCSKREVVKNKTGGKIFSIKMFLKFNIVLS